jgi:hypothetical protein
MPNPELLDGSEQDKALRDLMPVVDCLTNADIARNERSYLDTIEWTLKALRMFRKIPLKSPTIKAHTRWLAEGHFTED